MKSTLWILLFAAFSAGAAEDTTTQILAGVNTTSSEEIRLSAVFLLIEEQLADKGSSSVKVDDLISVSWADGSSELAQIGCFTDVLCVALVEGSQTKGFVEPLPDSAPIKPGAPRIEEESAPQSPVKPGGPRVDVLYEWAQD